jgi:hypothetical protein
MTAVAILGLVAVIVLWVLFGAALVFSPATLDGIWRSFRGLPLPVQIVGWIVLLPWVLGLVIWESSWATGRGLLWLLLYRGGLWRRSSPGRDRRRTPCRAARLEIDP